LRLREPFIGGPSGRYALRLRFALIGLFASVFATSLGIAASIYYVPLYIAYLGAGLEGVALMGVFRSLAYALLPAFVGRLADRFGRLRLYALSIFLNAAALVLMALSPTLTLAYASSLLMGAGYAFFWPISSAIAASISSQQGRLRAMAIYSLSWSTAFLIGPLVGGWLRTFLGYWGLFIASGLLVLLAPPWLTWIRLGQERQAGPITLNFPRAILPLYLAEIPHGMVYGVASSILPYYMAQNGLGDVEVGALFGLMGAARLLPLLGMLRPVGPGELPMLLAAMGLFLASFVLVGLLPHWGGFALGLGLLGLGLGLYYPAASSLISRRFDNRHLGLALGLLESIFGIGQMAGPPLGKELYTALGPGPSFVALGLLWLSMAPLLLAANRNPRNGGRGTAA